MDPLIIDLPIRTKTQGNNRRHWRADWADAKRQRERVWAALMQRKAQLPPLPVTLRLHRRGKRLLDRFVNLPSSFKHIVDEVAKVYGIDDRDERLVIPEPTQEVAKEYGVRIVIEETLR